MDARGIPPTYPFHVAKAYTQPASRPAAPSSKTQSIDKVELSKPRAKSVDTLVAGKVTVPANFKPARPSASADSLPMYHHPADKNAAATGISLGRTLDLNG
jgi:hypothetical protein